MDINDIIRFNIMRLRYEKGWSQTELGIQVDKSRSAITRIEGGSRCISIENLKLFANTFNVSVSDLLEPIEIVKEDKSMSEHLEVNVNEGEGNALHETVWYENRVALSEDRIAESSLSSAVNPEDGQIVYVVEVDGKEEDFRDYHLALEKYIRLSHERLMEIEKQLSVLVPNRHITEKDVEVSVVDLANEINEISKEIKKMQK